MEECRYRNLKEERERIKERRDEKEEHQESSRSKYLMFRLLRNSLGGSSASFFSARFCIINFLNSFRRISFSLASFSLSRRMISFFSSQSRRLAHSAYKLPNFSPQARSASLCQLSSFIISASISEIISTVTTFALPLRIRSLLSLIFSSISFRRLPFVTARSWLFSSCFSFSAVLAASVLHSSLILASCALLFSIFCVYFSSLLNSVRAFACSFRTFRKEVRSAQSCFTSLSSARTAFYFSTTAASSWMYSFSRLIAAISARSYCIFCYCLRASRRFSCVSRSPSSPTPTPYFLLNFSCERMSSICSASSSACFFRRLFCSMSRSRVCSLPSSCLGERQAELLGKLCPASSLTARTLDSEILRFFSLPALMPFSGPFMPYKIIHLL